MVSVELELLRPAWALLVAQDRALEERLSAGRAGAAEIATAFKRRFELDERQAHAIDAALAEIDLRRLLPPSPSALAAGGAVPEVRLPGIDRLRARLVKRGLPPEEISRRLAARFTALFGPIAVESGDEKRIPLAPAVLSTVVRRAGPRRAVDTGAQRRLALARSTELAFALCALYPWFGSDLRDGRRALAFHPLRGWVSQRRPPRARPPTRPAPDALALAIEMIATLAPGGIVDDLRLSLSTRPA